MLPVLWVWTNGSHMSTIRGSHRLYSRNIVCALRVSPPPRPPAPTAGHHPSPYGRHSLAFPGMAELQSHSLSPWRPCLGDRHLSFLWIFPFFNNVPWPGIQIAIFQRREPGFLARPCQVSRRVAHRAPRCCMDTATCRRDHRAPRSVGLPGRLSPPCRHWSVTSPISRDIFFLFVFVLFYIYWFTYFLLHSSSFDIHVCGPEDTCVIRMCLCFQGVLVRAGKPLRCWAERGCVWAGGAGGERVGATGQGPAPDEYMSQPPAGVMYVPDE